jgi:DNA-binding SARP family transcriptional activator
VSENTASEMKHERLHAYGGQSAQPLLRVSLLGPLRLEWQITPSTALALFLLLLFAPDRQASRSQLAGILWPEAPESNALESLRSALKVLRKVLSTTEGEVLIEAPKSGLLKLTDQSRLWVDMDAFEMLIFRLLHSLTRQILQLRLMWRLFLHRCPRSGNVQVAPQDS